MNLADYFSAGKRNRPRAIALVAIAVLIAQLSLFVSPAGFSGGPSDDQRYLEAALDWIAQGPHAGTTHWALRHPLVLSIVAIFHLTGPTLGGMLVVPRLYYALFVGVTAAGLLRTTGVRTMAFWVALTIASPVIHRMATSCYPEMLELAFGATSFWAFLAARGARGPIRVGLLAASGLALGLAVMTRETAAFLLLYYGWAFFRRSDIPRVAYVALAAGFVLPLGIDNLWLWSLTGDPLYRLHVDSRHVLIASDHLVGGVYNGGSPFLNADLASRWKPSGPTRIHWLINPLVDFLIEPQFGFVLAGLAISYLPWFAGRPPVERYGRAKSLLIFLAVASFVTVTWIFTLRPQPRYYLFATTAATIAFALYANAAFDRPELRRRAGALIGLVIFGGLVVLCARPDEGWQPKLIVPYIAAHRGTYSADANLVGRAAHRFERKELRDTLTTDPAPIGGYRIRLIKSEMIARGPQSWRDPAYKEITYLYRRPSWPERISGIGSRTALLVEQRER